METTAAKLARATREELATARILWQQQNLDSPEAWDMEQVLEYVMDGCGLK